MRPALFGAAPRQRGMALISALLLLVIVTVLAMSMFRSYGMQEKLAGNVREKQRAFNAAISAEQYAEWTLQTGNAPAAGACVGVVPSTTSQVCTNQLNTTGPNGSGDYSAVPWGIGVTYVPFTTDNGNGVQATVSTAPTLTGSGATQQSSYYKPPSYYITWLGKNATGTFYQIDAVGYGASPNAVAVVESTYLVSTSGPTSLDK